MVLALSFLGLLVWLFRLKLALALAPVRHGLLMSLFMLTLALAMAMRELLMSLFLLTLALAMRELFMSLFLHPSLALTLKLAPVL